MQCPQNGAQMECSSNIKDAGVAEGKEAGKRVLRDEDRKAERR